MKLEEEAKKDQGSFKYPGVDDWKEGKLSKGKLIGQFDYRYQPFPSRFNKDFTRTATGKYAASKYFASQEVIESCRDGDSINARKLAECLQIGAWKNGETKKHEYPRTVILYRVKKDIPCAESYARHNPAYGGGGGKQYFIDISEENLIQSSYLEVETTIQTKNRSPDLDLYRKIQQEQMPEKSEGEFVQEAHDTEKLRLRRGTASEKMQARRMERLENESRQLKEKATHVKSEHIRKGGKAWSPWIRHSEKSPQHRKDPTELGGKKR